MNLPVIQAESQKARIGVESGLGQYNIHSSPADIQVHTTPVQMSAPTPQPQIDIDQSRMWAAFNGGKPVEFINKIYSQMPAIALQGIAKIVENGNRMGDLRIRNNPIPEIALESMFEGGPELEIFGPASCDNVDISFIPEKPDIQVELGKRDVRVETHKPEIEYQRNDVRIYMEQYPQVSFRVAHLDIRA